MEFRAIEDTVNEDSGHRIVSKAQMFGFGVVDSPAYPGSVASMRAWGEYRTAECGLIAPDRPEPVTTRRFFMAG